MPCFPRAASGKNLPGTRKCIPGEFPKLHCQQARPLGTVAQLRSNAVQSTPAGSACPSAGLTMGMMTIADRTTATSVLSQHDATILRVSFTSALDLTLHAEFVNDL